MHGISPRKRIVKSSISDSIIIALMLISSIQNPWCNPNTFLPDPETVLICCKSGPPLLPNPVLAWCRFAGFLSNCHVSLGKANEFLLTPLGYWGTQICCPCLAQPWLRKFMFRYSNRLGASSEIRTTKFQRFCMLRLDVLMLIVWQGSMDSNVKVIIWSFSLQPNFARSFR